MLVHRNQWQIVLLLSALTRECCYMQKYGSANICYVFFYLISKLMLCFISNPLPHIDLVKLV